VFTVGMVSMDEEADQHIHHCNATQHKSEKGQKLDDVFNARSNVVKAVC
jgi:hypothetical protein